MTDREIFSLWQVGQQEKAFGEIVDNYSERLYWHVRRLVYSHEDADDLLQDIFVKIWKSLHTFRGESQLFTWLYRIATNETLNFLHKQKIRASHRFASITPELEDKIEDDPYFNGDALQRALLKAVRRLPDKQRTVFTMRYYDDLSYEEIAKILGTSVGALKASYHFAAKKIRAELQKSAPCG